MSSSIRLRRAGFVVVLTVGVLGMHGLATAANGDDANKASVVSAVAGTHTGHPSSDDDGHSPLHVIGELCLWLVVGGALLIGGRTVISSSIRPRDDKRRTTNGPPTPPAPVGRSPDPTLGTVALRC